MDLQLSKNDFCQVGIVQQKSMRLLPLTKDAATQKVAVADQQGVLQVFSVKDYKVKTVFKTAPDKPINRLCLGGEPGMVKEKLLIAAKSEVKAFSMKGKQILQFDTNMAEEVNVMHLEGNDLFVCGNHIYQHFNSLKDVAHLLCVDRIQDLLVLPMEKTKTPIPVLACADRVLRILENSQVSYQIEVSGPPSCLELHIDEGGVNGNELLYGTSDGRVGFVKLMDSAAIYGWSIQNPESFGGILCMDHYDMLGDGVPSLLLGRDDGNVEIWSYDEVMEPQLKYSKACNESLSSIQAGRVSHPDHDEIVCAAHSGWIFSLTTESNTKAVSATGIPVVDENLAAKMAALKEEVEQLQQQVVRERERYEQSAQSKKSVSAMPHFHIQDKFQLNPEEAAYSLVIECVTPIEIILVQSDAPVDLLDSDKNSAVVSHSQCKPEEGNHLLVTYRCQADTTRLELKVRSIEGQHGIVQIYVTPRTLPKVCQVRRFSIKPLSLHKRVQFIDEARPMSVLRLKGAFSLAEMHSWVFFCLPECPERVPTGSVENAVEPSVSLSFQSTFLGTQLQCFYRKGEATFYSDNLSTISILKDTISHEATKKKISLNISFDVHPKCVEHTLHLLHPKMEELLLLAKQVQLIEPLQELMQYEGDSQNDLSPEYMDILKHADSLQAQFKKQPCHLERLYGMITDLYIDKFKFLGQNVKHRVPQLLDLLYNYDFDELVKFFEMG